jgi:chromosome segregation ATPase
MRDDAQTIVAMEKASSDNLEKFSTKISDMEVDYAKECSEAEKLGSVDIQALQSQEEEVQKELARLENLLKEAAEEKVLIQNTFSEETNTLVGKFKGLTTRINECQVELSALGEQLVGGVESAFENASETEINNLVEKYAGVEGEYDKKENEMNALEAELKAGTDKIAELEKINTDKLEELENRFKVLKDDYTRKSTEADQLSSDRSDTLAMSNVELEEIS